jgi:hypothetical protein
VATINTDEDFRLAASTWADANPGEFTGTRFIDATGRKIYDETTNPNPPPGVLLNDVTPSQAALEAALDDALAAIAQQQEIEEARAAITQIRTYLQQQLVKVSPDTPATIVTTIKDIANGNTFLARIMTNQVSVMNSAHGWSLTQNPATAQTRNQYIKTVEIILGIYPLL